MITNITAINNIQKGQVIPVSYIENLLGLSCTDADYDLGKLNLRNTIVNYYKSKNIHLEIKSEGKALRVLTDAEAINYLGNGFKNDINRAYGKYQRTLKIDKNNLTEDEKLELRRLIETDSRITTAITRTVKTITMDNSNSKAFLPKITRKIKSFAI